ncbi:MAG: hypothetical protein IT204_10965 [Fimbriimonadaceae bacterium]|nr:hypothetical protein [Fimbriimonadaceae bacterium]
MTPLERFDAVMTYGTPDRLPHWELGAWGQALERWEQEGIDPTLVRGDWFAGLPGLGCDPKIFAPLDFKLRPYFEYLVIEETERYLVARNGLGVVTKALKEGTVHGTRMSMDQYLHFPVETLEDFEALKQRYDPTDPARYPANWDELVAAWRQRDCPLVLGRTCLGGFYWNMREWMGTENLSFALVEQPRLVHAMCEFFADFVIEVTRRARRDIQFDYFILNEDIAFKSAPLLSPEHYRQFIVPPMKRLISTLKSAGVRWVGLDTDGNAEPLLPLMIESGVDIFWPLERAAEHTDPAFLRQVFGRDLRLWGGVDKREIARGPAAIDAHLRSLAPMVEAGGYVPTLDHTFPPDISRADFEYYLAQKMRLLRGEFGA